MRIILCLLLLLTPVWAKAQSTAFDDAMAGLDKVFEAGGDPDRIYQYLTQTVRTSRALGRNEPDFAIFYAMLADHLGDDARALRLSEAFMQRVVANFNNTWEMTAADMSDAVAALES